MKKYFKENKGKIILLILVAIIFSGLVSLSPLIIGNFIDNISVLTTRKIIIYAVLFIGDVTFILLFEYIQKIIHQRLYQKVMISIKNDIFSKLMNRSYKDYYKYNTEDYINLFVEDVNTLYNDYFDTVIGTVITFVSLITYSVIVFLLNWIMALAIILTALLALLIPKIAGHKLSTKRKKQSQENASYIGRLKDLLAGYQINNKITIDKIKTEHNIANEKKEEATFEFGKYNSFVQIFGGLSLYVMNIVVFIVGMILISIDYLKVSELFILISFTDLMVIPITDFIYELINIKSSKEIKNKIESFLDYQKQNSTIINSFKNNISLQDVTVQNEQFTLTINNLTFNKGKKYAIIGPSGSGKTTLLKLILGHYQSYTGSICIDNDKINDQDCSYIISEINQNAYIFNDTGLNNITLFGSYQNDNLDKYIDMLNAQNLVSKPLGEFGNNISGGEKNKIAILRALCKGCNIFLCDEMFANLDDASKQDINDFLLKSKDLTIIAVSHDISKKNLKQYDEIVILNNGQVKETITPDQLDKLFARKDFLWD